MKNKHKRVIPFFISFILVCTLFFGLNTETVFGAQQILTDWENAAIGATNGTTDSITFHTTYDDTGYCNISDGWSNSGDNSYRLRIDNDPDVNAEAVLWWNLTNTYTYINYIQFYANSSYKGSGLLWWFQFYNNGVNDLSIRIYDGKLQNFDVSTGWTTTCDLADDNVNDSLIRVTHNDTNSFWFQVWNYTDSNTSLHASITDAGATTNTWTTFDSIKITATDAGGGATDQITYIDDILINTGLAQGDTSNLEAIGSTSCDDFIYGNYGVDYLETKFTGYLTTTVRALDLLVDTADDDPNNYQAWLNGVSLGAADFLFTYGNGQVARWTGFALNLNNEQLVAEWRHYEATPGDNTVWRWVAGVNNYIDLNGDGWRGVYLHDDSNKINGVFDALTSAYDVCWRFYFDAESWTPDPPNPSWTDDLEFSGEGYLGTSTNGTEQYRQYTTVFITWGVSSIALDNYMYIYDDSFNLVGLTQQVYYGESFSPLRLLDGAYDGTVGFVPYSTGMYYVTIERNSVEVANDSFYSIANTDNYWLYSVPNPSLRDNSYNVYYRYNNSNNDGYLLVFDPYENDIEWGQELQRFYLGSGDLNGFVPYYPQYNPEGNHLWVIFVEVGTNMYVPQVQHEHLIRSDFYSDNTVNAVDDAVVIDENQVINYYHNFVGGEVYLFINGVQTYSIGDIQSTNIVHLCDTLGSQNVSMWVLLNGTWYLLDWDIWQTTTDEGEVVPGDGAFLPELGRTFGAILGIMIVSFFTLMPLALQTMAGQKGMTLKVPIPVYTLMGVLGMILAFYLGLFELWVFFFALAMAVLALGMMYIIKPKSEGE